MISLARYCGRESGDEKVLRILGVARFDPASQENAVPGLKNSCRLPLHFSFTNDLGTSASAFDSKKEADYYCELKLKLQSNIIKGFCLQPTFILAPGLKYKADFIVFNSDNTYDVIDVKGFKTKEYIAKKKVFEDKYNLKITEIE